MQTERRHDIDWLRVIAIWFLLIYHIAIIFQPWAMFMGFIKSDDLMPDLWTPMTMLNVWRIPILFFVSGMGVFFAIRKRNFKQLVIERSQRILLPFIFGYAAISPIHMYLFQKYYGMPAAYFPHMGHLWFLGNIFCYVLILSPIFYYLKKNEDGKLKKALTTLMSNPLGPLVVTVFFIIEALAVKPQIYSLYAQTWHGFFLGLIAFFFGFLFVYIGKTFWQTVLKWRWAYFAAAAVLFALRLTIFKAEPNNTLIALESNLWIFSIFGFCYKYLNKPSKTLSYLSQAAYPVYIVHMFVLYAAALVILPLEMAVEFKLIAIIAFTAIGCYALYEGMIRRIAILRPLFGLKWNPKKKDSQIVDLQNSLERK